MQIESERGVDYSNLQKLLQEKRWKESDWETAFVILQAVGRESWQPVKDEWLLNFPSKDLKTIDQLWVQASQGRYGFSIQKRIWQECGSPISDNDDWQRFCERIEWPRDVWVDKALEKLKWDGTGVIGHLPTWGVRAGLHCWRGGGVILSLLSHKDL